MLEKKEKFFDIQGVYKLSEDLVTPCWKKKEKCFDIQGVYKLSEDLVTPCWKKKKSASIYRVCINYRRI